MQTALFWETVIVGNVDLSCRTFVKDLLFRSSSLFPLPFWVDSFWVADLFYVFLSFFWMGPGPKLYFYSTHRNGQKVTKEAQKFWKNVDVFGRGRGGVRSNDVQQKIRNVNFIVRICIPMCTVPCLCRPGCLSKITKKMLDALYEWPIGAAG